MKALDRMNKECDLGYVVRNIRILRYFLKTVLDKDQRVLIKLKASEHINSESESHKQVSFSKK